MITTTVTAHGIRLIVETIITSNTDMPYRVDHHAQRTPPHHGFSLLISIECACIEDYS